VSVINRQSLSYVARMWHGRGHTRVCARAYRSGMRVTYNKLVRDRIPEMIEADGHHAVTRILDRRSYRAALLAKLGEEAREAQGASADELPSELADVWEVLQALLSTLPMTWQEHALSGVWRPGPLEDLPGAVNDLLAVGFAWGVPLLGPLSPLDGRADERPEDGGVIRGLPGVEPALLDQPGTVFGGQISCHDQLTQPADEFPAGGARVRWQGGREAEFVAGEGEQLVCFGFFFAAQPGQLHQRGAVDTGEDRVEGDLDQLIGTDVLADPFVDCCHA
jgi:predicted house-cleaning noncanonical NTP pyrophosphatase (MazG superfamily)